MENIDLPEADVQTEPNMQENISPPQTDLPAQAGASFFAKLKTKWPVWISIGIASVAIISFVFYAAYSYGNRGQEPQPTPTPTTISLPTPIFTVTPLSSLISTPALTTIEEKLPLPKATNIKFTNEFLSSTQEDYISTKGNLFFLKYDIAGSGTDASYGQVLMIDKFGQNEKSIVDFNIQHAVSPKVINEDSIGIVLVHYYEDFPIGEPRPFPVYSIDLNTQIIREFVVNELNTPIVGWRDEKSFAYLIDEQFEEGGEMQLRWNLYLVDQNGNKLLYQSPKLDNPNYLIGFHNLSFSPNKNKILFNISPGSHGYYTPTYHEICVYDLQKNKLYKIHFDVPEEKRGIGMGPSFGWIDDENIFIQIPKVKATIYSADLVLKRNLDNFPVDRYGILNRGEEKIVYTTEENLQTIWLYDLNTAEQTKVLEGYGSPKWIYGNEMLVTELDECAENDTRVGCSEGIPEQLRDFKPHAAVATYYYNNETANKVKLPSPTDQYPGQYRQYATYCSSQ